MVKTFDDPQRTWERYIFEYPFDKSKWVKLNRSNVIVEVGVDIRHRCRAYNESYMEGRMRSSTVVEKSRRNSISDELAESINKLKYGGNE